MINQVMLVGRLTKNPELFLTENGKTGSFITLAVGRPYKNVDGVYETDFLDCTLWTGIAENTAEYCKKGDIVGVRGRLQSRIIENDDGSKYKRMEIVADKVTFLSTKKDESEELENLNSNDEVITEIPILEETDSSKKKKEK